MRKSKYYHYYVEGQDEEKILSVLKTEMRLIIPGKIERFNVVEREFTKSRIMLLKKGTVVILVFDTDTGNANILKKNIELLKKQSMISDVLCITQVKNLEDELKRSCGLKQIKELTGSRSNHDFKRDLLKDNSLKRKLEEKHFEVHKFWSCSDDGAYKEINNDADKIKLV